MTLPTALPLHHRTGRSFTAPSSPGKERMSLFFILTSLRPRAAFFPNDGLFSRAFLGRHFCQPVVLSFSSLLRETPRVCGLSLLLSIGCARGYVQGD